MAQYIDKSAVVAEINRRVKTCEDYAKCNLTETTIIGNNAQLLELRDILSFLDTLEVKEVNLDFERELYKTFGQVKDFTLGMHIAKHFFELGVKVQANNVWHSYAEPIDTNRTILILSPNGNSSLALWDGKSLSTTSIDRGHNILCNGDKWTYVEDLVQKGE